MNTIWLDLMYATQRFAGKRYKTRVIQSGSGPALIQLHGTGGHAEAYSRNIARLSQDFTVYAIDLLWHAQSDKPAFKGQTIELWVDQIIDLLDSEGIESAYIEGESLGGWIALYLALTHPGRVKSMVLNTTGGVRNDDNLVKHDDLAALRDRSIAALTQPTSATIRSRLEWLMASPDRVTDELVALRLAYYSRPDVQEALKPVILTQLDPDFRNKYELGPERLAELSCRSLVLWTEKNPHRNEAAGRQIAERIPNSTFYLMKDAAHWPQWEKPEEHDRVVREFFLQE